MSEFDDNFIEKVKKDMQKSGFPLEIEVSSILNSSGWDVQNQGFYIDEQENKPRAIDIIASKILAVEASKYFTNFNIYLIIECKKSQKPWLFYTTQSSLKEHPPILHVKGASESLRLSRVEAPKGHEFDPEFAKQVITLASLSHYFSPKQNRDGIIPYEPFTQGEGRQVFTAVNQVIKATKYQLSSLKEVFSIVSTELSNMMPEIRPFIIVYPLIVFEGKLLECRLEDGEFEICETGYVRYIKQEAAANHVIEIVSKVFFKEYLKVIGHEIDVIRNRI